MTHVAIYCRVSTDLQNIDQQRQILVDYCNKNNYSYRTYKDEAESGTISDRPQWQQLLKDCDIGTFDMIVVSKWDRITRDLGYAIEFINWLKGHSKIKLYSLYDGFFDITPDRIFNFKLMCLLSEYELEINRWRMRIGIERAKKEGKYKYGRGRPKPKT